MNPETSRWSGWVVMAVYVGMFVLAVAVMVGLAKEKLRRWWRGEEE
jgi:hypothetical protein